MPERKLPWWQTGIIYHVYPRSFQDSNGDGIGDLNGITARLEHVAWLGATAVWLSPIYASPMRDFGYDVAGYTDVHPDYGRLEDFDALVRRAHELGLRVLLDFVPNHSSSEHPWFRASRSSRDDPKRDWYVWRDPATNGGPPNNWLSFFGHPAWTLDPTTGQYYFHQFLRDEPDLNWRNPDVRAAMLNAMRFWLDRGVDGFRVDTLWLLAEAEHLRDEPPDPTFRPGDAPVFYSLEHAFTQDQPETLEYVREMRGVLDEYSTAGRERVMIGEIYLPFERLEAYRAAGCQLPFNFSLVRNGTRMTPWNAREVRRVVDAYDASTGGAWGNYVLGNHDNARFATRWGEANARAATLLLFTLRGTPTWYYGDEIGMTDVPIPPDRRVDVAGLLQPDLPAEGRDPERTPMQWSDAPFAGFSRVEPWLPVAADHARVNVARQRDDAGSMLNFVRAAIRARSESPDLVGGAYASFDAGDDDVFAFRRGERVIVAINFAARDACADLSAVVPGARVRVLLDTGGRSGEVFEAPAVRLPPHGGTILQLE